MLVIAGRCDRFICLAGEAFIGQINYPGTPAGAAPIATGAAADAYNLLVSYGTIGGTGAEDFDGMAADAMRLMVWIGRQTSTAVGIRGPNRSSPSALPPRIQSRAARSAAAATALFLDDALVPARFLVGDMHITTEDHAVVDYFHVELTSRAIILAEGLLAGSYLDCSDRGDFAKGSGPARLCRDLAATPPRDVWEVQGCAPLCHGGAQVAAIRERLATKWAADDQPTEIEMKRRSSW